MPRKVSARFARRIWTRVRRERARDGARLRAAFALLVLAVCPGLSGCILGSERPELNLDVPAAYRAGPKGGAADTALPALDWWHGFRSSELTALMDAAQVYNFDIAVAIAQIIQADAQVGVSGHETLGLGVANSILAARAGAKQIDGSTRRFGAGAGNTPVEAFAAVAYSPLAASKPAARTGTAVTIAAMAPDRRMNFIA